MTHEGLKHAVDATAIPGGIVAGAAHYMDWINSGMTFLVLLTSLIWGVYRIVEMHEKRRVKVEQDNRPD